MTAAVKTRSRPRLSRRPSRRQILQDACWHLYRHDPAGYALDILGVDLTPSQEEILAALCTSPYRVACPASTNAGKSYVGAVAMSWFHDTFPDSLVLSTGPTLSTVRDCAWKELRHLRERAGLGGFTGPKSLRLQDGNRVAAGLVSRDPTAFQGRHSRNVFLLFDEATGVPSEFWDRALPMLQGDRIAMLCLGNPTTTASRFYAECESGEYRTIHLSAVDHPNILAELAGLPAPYPSAVRLSTLDGMLRKWCQAVAPGEEEPTDIEWPLGSGQHLRPGPEAEGLLLGRWPSQATNAVWSALVWSRCERLAESSEGDLTIGCDVARFGDDQTCVLVRKGAEALEAQERNGLTTIQTAALARDLAEKWAPRFEDEKAKVPPGQGRPKLSPKKVPIRVDDAGVGGGVTDQLRAWGYKGVPCLGCGRPLNPKLYPNRRSETWFCLAEAAAEGFVSFARLPPAVRGELRRQLLGTTYTLNEAGQRVVESKDRSKARLKRSPDLADAAMLAYADTPKFEVVRLA